MKLLIHPLLSKICFEVCIRADLILKCHVCEACAVLTTTVIYGDLWIHQVPRKWCSSDLGTCIEKKSHKEPSRKHNAKCILEIIPHWQKILNNQCWVAFYLTHWFKIINTVKRKKTLCHQPRFEYEGGDFFHILLQKPTFSAVFFI